MAVTHKDVKITVIRKPIRRMYLHLKRDGTVWLSVPLSTPEAEWRRFVDSKMPWIEKNLAELAKKPDYLYQEGEAHYYLGERRVLHLAYGPVGTEFGLDRTKPGVIEMHMPHGHWDFQKVYIYLAAEELQAILEKLCAEWAPRMGVTYSSITIKRVKSFWGSCQVKTGALSFALDLITKPLPCIEEVVVHELNHRLEKGHTKRFHALMAHWLPDYKARNEVLKKAPREFV